LLNRNGILMCTLKNSELLAIYEIEYNWTVCHNFKK